jgi:hypothetical protein
VILQASGIDTFYGETQALFDVSIDVGAGEGRGAPRRERGRQDDDAALDPRASRRRAAGASCSTETT